MIHHQKKTALGEPRVKRENYYSSSTRHDVITTIVQDNLVIGLDTNAEFVVKDLLFHRLRILLQEDECQPQTAAVLIA